MKLKGKVPCPCSDIATVVDGRTGDRWTGCQTCLGKKWVEVTFETFVDKSNKGDRGVQVP